MKNNKNYINLNFEKQIEGCPITKKNSRGWVNYGLKNDYPYQLLNLYNNSPTMRACINFSVQSIIGDGVDIESMKLDSNDTVPNYQETWDEFLRKISIDFMLYGSYAFQILKNKDGKTFSFYHIPYEQVRWSAYDEDGCITEYYICQDWTQLSKYSPIKLDAFEMRDDFSVKQGKPYIYVYRNYSPSMTYYTSPTYTSAIKSIMAEIEMCSFDLKHITNGFVPSGMLELAPVETDEERNEIIDNINRMFVGGENANSLMITFSNGTGESPAKFIPFNNGGESSVNVYADSNNRQINRIMSSFNIPSKTLIGLPDEGGSGFNSEAAVIETAYRLYNKLTGNYNRQCIVKTINYLFKMNGIDTEIILKPLTFNDINIMDDTKVDVNVNEVKEDNIEEQTTTIQ